MMMKDGDEETIPNPSGDFCRQGWRASIYFEFIWRQNQMQKV